MQDPIEFAFSSGLGRILNRDRRDHGQAGESKLALVGYNGSVTRFNNDIYDDSTMTQIFHPFLALIASATDKELARYVEFLKAENKILLSRAGSDSHEIG